MSRLGRAIQTGAPPAKSSNAAVSGPRTSASYSGRWAWNHVLVLSASSPANHRKAAGLKPSNATALADRHHALDRDPRPLGQRRVDLDLAAEVAQGVAQLGQ